MTTFVVEATWTAVAPLSEEVVFSLAELGGVGVGDPGGPSRKVIFSQPADDLAATERLARERIETAAVGGPPGTVTGMEVTDAYTWDIANGFEPDEFA